jgi:hypothetical protein
MGEMTDGTQVKKHHELFFLNSNTAEAPNWIWIKKSTDNTIAMNPETEVRDFIVDESPTTILTKYAPGMTFPITMYKGEEDYEYFYALFYNLKAGSDAESELLFVDYAHGDTNYNAWKATCLVVIDNMNPVDSTITANITINGTVETGTATITDEVPAFAGDDTIEFILTVTCQINTTPEAGATVMCGGVTKITDDDGKCTFNLIDEEQYVIGAVAKTSEKVSEIFTADSNTDTKTLTLVDP